MRKTDKSRIAIIMTLILITAIINAQIARIEVKATIYEYYEYEDFEYDILDNDTIELIHYTGKGGNVVIPGEIEGKRVTVINNSIFSEHTNVLYSVTIPNGIEKIGLYSFINCINLTTITIPASVKEFSFLEYKNSNPFTNCWNLEEIKVDANNTVFDSRQNCNAIIRKSDNTLISGCKNTVIPDDVTSIGELAFSDSKFYNITIPDSVTSIGYQAFYSCTNLITITIPANVKNISSQSFDFCTHMSEIKVDTNNTVFDSRQDCNAIIRKSDNVLIFGCKNTVIPDDVTSIGDYAFSGCIDLSGIIIPDSVTSIGSYAFRLCNYLSGITIPDSVTSIGSFAFYSCNNLTDISISDSVTSIGNSAFESCRSLTNITIPNSITNINSSTFGDCKNLTALFIPESVTSIEDDVFYGYYYYSEPSSDLVIYTTPDSYTEQWAKSKGYAIKYHDFSKEDDSDMEKPTTEEPTTEEPTTEELTPEKPDTQAPVIQMPATQTPGTIKATTISETNTTKQPDSLPAVPEIGKIYTVKGMRYKVTSSKNVSFSGGEKNSMTNLTIPDKVVILEKTFQVTAVEEKACKKYKKLKTVVIGKNIKIIGNEAFYGCTKLKNVTLGKNVTTIGKKVFYGNKKLTRIIIKGADLQKIGKKTLYKVPKKVRITAPKKAIQKYKKLLIAAR